MPQKTKHSIRRRMTGIIMLTSTTAVLLVCLGFVTSNLINLRSRLAGDLATLAQVVSSNSTAALTFGDHQGAQEVLSALRARPSIVAACLYSERGQLFASYQPNASISIPAALPRDGFYDRADRLELFQAISLGRQRIGTLYIASDSRDRNAQLKQYVEIAAGIVLVSLLIAFVLSSRLQRQISEPIVELARVASIVSNHKDYSIRATAPGSSENDEIGRLMIGFNGMLAEIEQRDQKLRIATSDAEKTAEVNARRARESALILNTATDGILCMDVHGVPNFLNPAGARMLGRSLSGLQGKSVHELIHHSYPDGTPFPEADCPVFQAAWRGEPYAVADDVFWRPDGTTLPVEYSSTPMLDEDGTARGAVVLFRDVTERRAIDRMKGEFVSTVSHELRTPLTSIRGALGLLGSGLLGPMADRGQRMLEIAISNTDRLVRLINDILDLERIGSRTVEMTRFSVDANSVMHQACAGLHAVASQAGVRIEIVPASATLLGDSDRIIQTLTNLLGNSIKFSPPGTTTTLSGSAQESDFVFCISDQGRGVPAEKLESIFDRFSQVDASDSREIGGTGLGLAICRSIVTAHGGRIWAERNDPAAGMRFQFTIPLAHPVNTAIDTEEHEEPGSLGQVNDTPYILLIEGDLDLAGIMSATLQNQGFPSIHATTGSDAVQKCRRSQPQVIVLDPTLPDMPGFELVRLLRESPALGCIPLIVYSTLDVASADRPRLHLGPTTFLTKSRCSLAEFAGHVTQMVTPEKHLEGPVGLEPVSVAL